MFHRNRGDGLQEKHAIRHSAPGWFAVVMGTGGLANILSTGKPLELPVD